MIVHGTTVATNALLEGKGVRAGLLITKGYRAVYEARGWSQPHGADLLDTFYQKPPLLVPQYLTEEVVERLDYEGHIVTPLDEASLRASVRKLAGKDVEATPSASCSRCQSGARAARGRDRGRRSPHCRISISSEVLPVIREYPRLSTTVIDAYVGPRIANYLHSLEQRLDERGIATPQNFLMQSNGGLMRISLGARHPNQTLLSGPAAGVIAGADLARATERAHVVTFDMGGTSTDISVIVDGAILEMSQGQIAGQDIGTPMLRVRTLGAGGGTVAEIGKDGLLKVGPRSSGSIPGPACYGRGGTEATVTDANLLLGALSSGTLLAGTLRLDEAAARSALERTGAALGMDALQTASGIVRIVNTHMAVDVRLALQEQGQDPRLFALVAFGGAGPLHAATLARSVGNIDRAGTALPRSQLRARHVADERTPFLPARSEIGSLQRIAVDRVNGLFASSRGAGHAGSGRGGLFEEPGPASRACSICATRTRAIHFASPARRRSTRQPDDGQAPLRYAPQDRPARARRTKTPTSSSFRLQLEIVVPRLSLPELAPQRRQCGARDQGPAAAVSDTAQQKFRPG